VAERFGETCVGDQRHAVRGDVSDRYRMGMVSSSCARRGEPHQSDESATVAAAWVLTDVVGNGRCTSQMTARSSSG
jgi:hypothetical protein